MRTALEQGKALSELTREDLARFSDLLDDEYYEVLSGSSWLESKLSEGGTATARIEEQLARARQALRRAGEVVDAEA